MHLYAFTRFTPILLIHVATIYYSIIHHYIPSPSMVTYTRQFMLPTMPWIFLPLEAHKSVPTVPNMRSIIPKIKTATLHIANSLWGLPTTSQTKNRKEKKLIFQINIILINYYASFSLNCIWEYLEWSISSSKSKSKCGGYSQFRESRLLAATFFKLCWHPWSWTKEGWCNILE